MLETDAHRNAAFCIYNANELPLLEVTNVIVKNLDGGLKEVSATIENRRMLPTHSASNMKFRIDHPDYVTLDGATVLSGMLVDDVLRNRTTEQKKNPRRIEVNNIPGHSQVDVRWIVKGGTRFAVSVESVKGGIASAESK